MPFPVIDFMAMVGRQQLCQSVQLAKSSPSLMLQVVDMKGAKLLCDVAHGATWPVVIVQVQQNVFQAVHGMAHSSIRATCRLVSARFVWHDLARDIGNWCHDYQTCQRGKVTKQPAAPLQECFSHVHVDLVGPLPPSEKGHVYRLTIIDRATR